MRFAGAILVLLGLSACTPAPEKLTLTPTDYTQLQGWHATDHAQALSAFQKSCDKKYGMKEGATIGKGPLAAPLAAWYEACDASTAIAPARARGFFETHFTPFTASGDKGEQGLITGYYEPELSGSLRRHGPYQTPVYALPDDVKAGTPYFTREEIDSGALSGRGLELAWVKDPVALFFLHIQGSGIVRLENGKALRIGYAGKNNRAYIALGKVMIDEGLLEKERVTMFTIKEWLYAHPGEAQALMQKNPSYVFFRVLEKDGPLGAEGTALTSGHSIAIDPRYLPYGLPVYLETTLPDAQQTPLHRLTVAQDTGGAIKGAVRADVFFGRGKKAERYAGGMKQPGRYTLLVPNAIAETLE